jgi:predicted TPR repeat methyltransferase
LAEAYRAKGDYKGAAGAYEKSLELLPDNKWLWSMVISMCELSGDTRRAKQAYEKGAKVEGYYCKTFYCF